MKTLKDWHDKALALLERLDKWWDTKAKPEFIKIEKQPDYLEGRVIYCVECDCRRTLWRYGGRMVCGACCSDAWLHPTSMISFLYKEYHVQSS